MVWGGTASASAGTGGGPRAAGIPSSASIVRHVRRQPPTCGTLYLVRHVEGALSHSRDEMSAQRLPTNNGFAFT